METRFSAQLSPDFVQFSLSGYTDEGAWAFVSMFYYPAEGKLTHRGNVHLPGVPAHEFSGPSPLVTSLGGVSRDDGEGVEAYLTRLLLSHVATAKEKLQ